MWKYQNLVCSKVMCLIYYPELYLHGVSLCVICYYNRNEQKGSPCLQVKGETTFTCDVRVDAMYITKSNLVLDESRIPLFELFTFIYIAPNHNKSHLMTLHI